MVLNEKLILWIGQHTRWWFLLHRCMAKAPTSLHMQVVCLFDSLRPINNLSVIKGQVFLGWTSTKLGLMFLLKHTTQWRLWVSNPWPLGLESSTLPRSHSAPYASWRRLQTTFRHLVSLDTPEWRIIRGFFDYAIRPNFMFVCPFLMIHILNPCPTEF